LKIFTKRKKLKLIQNKLFFNPRILKKITQQRKILKPIWQKTEVIRQTPEKKKINSESFHFEDKFCWISSKFGNSRELKLILSDKNFINYFKIHNLF